MAGLLRQGRERYRDRHSLPDWPQVLGLPPGGQAQHLV